MKQSIQLIKRTGLTFVSLFITALAMAQDSGEVTTTTTKTTTTETVWYMQPWAWVVGGVILLLIIILAARGGGNKDSRTDRVTVTKTVRTDSDTV